MSDHASYESPKKYHHKTRAVIFTMFIVIMGLLILTSFYGFSFTGNVVENIALSKKNSTVDIKADLTIPNLDVDGKFGSVTIKGGSNSNIYVGGQKFYLGNSNSNMIYIDNFDGKISFDSNSISVLKGKAGRVSVNGVPITPKKEGATLNLEIESGFRYDFLEIMQGVSIDKLNYVTSGTINNEKNIFKVENEEVSMMKFQGKMTLDSGRFKVEGKVSKLDIMGKQGVSITSQ